MLKRLLTFGAALVALCHAPAHAQFAISEFMADNVTAADVDEDTSHSDWVEIQNVTTTAASLNGWYLTDDPGNLRKWQFPVTTPSLNVAAGGFVVVWCSDKNRKAVATKLHTNFKLSAGGEYLALVMPDGVTIAQAFGVPQVFDPYPPQFPNGTYGRSRTTQLVDYVPETGEGKGKVPVDAADFANNFTGWNTSTSFNDATWQTGNGGFGFVNGADSDASIFQGLIGAGGDLGAIPNRAAFIRYKFNVPTLENLIGGQLKVKFDDGYACYLNGTPLTPNNAPASPVWNSPANAQRSDLSASFFIQTNLTPNQINVGTNLLAFALVDDAVEVDAGAVLHPWLQLNFVTGLAAPGYFASPTRGANNGAVKTTIGASISDTTDKPPQPAGGAGSADLVITAKVTKTLQNISTVNLKWRRMYLSENTLVMVDNGTNGDAVSGDGIYTAKIPTTSLLAGEMVRWRIEVRDTAGVYSYDPPYPHASNPPTSTPSYGISESEMYFGTIATPVLQGNTLLPVLHWFITPGTESTAETEAGTRSSFFFQPLSKNNPGPNYTPPKPIFYDNVIVRLHGQSSSGFPKKSHDLGFSKDNKFVWKDGEPDSSGLNLLSNYADKTKIRNTLAWYGWEKSGNPTSHYSVLLRVQRNAAFQGLYDVVENANAAWLKRAGFDEGDALYKVYNSLQNATISPNNDALEKKNPDDLVYTDVEAFVAGINQGVLSNRLRYIYDNVDIESLINFLAMHSIILNRDFGHKNYYIYRDSFGTGEWMPLPWDQDLSFGHTWNSGPAYFDDDIHSQGPLQTGGGGNMLMQLVYQCPELNAMYVRRLRTLAELFYGGAAETNGAFAQKANQTLDLIDPNPNNPAAGNDDADLEMRKWGFWVDNNGAKIDYTNGAVGDHTVRAQGARIVSSNPHPTYPGANPYAGWGDNSTSLPAFLPGRRDFFFNASPPLSGSLAFPPTQVASPTLVIEQFNPNPAIGNQSQEYFVIRNTTASSVDISGWKITGDVNLTFRGGTVLLPLGTAVTSGSTASTYINQVVVANKPAGFRAKAASPKGNEFRFVVGPYDRQLSARGGSVTLSKPINPLDLSAGYTPVLTQAYTGTPTNSQNFLRITEINYRPAPAIQAELDLVPGLVAGDFEFIEITNTGNVTLNLGGATFEEGIAFTFPAGYTLAAGQRCIIVASQAAFEARYGLGLPVLGNWEGALDNAGERLRLVDSVGEEVLDFTYQADWFPLPSGQYRTLVMKSATPDYTTYSTGNSWALSTAQGGTPNNADTGGYSSVYEGWRLSHFTDAELPTVASPNLAAALLQDPDSDGLNNFMEYCFGRLPKTADNTLPLTTPGTINVGGNNYLTVTFVRAKNALDVTYQVEASSDLINPNSWSNVGILVSTTDLGNGREQVTYRDNTPIGTGSRSLHVRAFKP